MGMDNMADKQLHLLDSHDQVNVTWGLVVVVHVELALWICRIYQIISALNPSFISINVNLKN